MTERRAATRLMLVELFPTALRRNERSMLFPFLQGLARLHGVATRWICFGGDPGRGTPAGAAEEDARSFAALVDDFGPSHVVSSAPLPAAMAAKLGARAPTPRVIVPPAIGDVRDPRYAGLLSADERDRRFFARCAWFLDWLGVDDPAWAGRYLVDDAPPDYQAVMANEAARTSKAHITIAGGVLCANRRAVRDNPLFRDVALPAPPAGPGGDRDTFHGCTFCGSDRVSLTAPGADSLAAIERQLRGVLATAGAGGRDKGIFELYDIHAFQRLDEVFEIVLRLGLPPSVFLFNPRVDDVLRARDRIDRVLPALAAAGHEVRILSMGLESFSERENARFNKGITVAQIDELLALLDRWGQAWPNVFNPFKGGHQRVELGFILFSPWTTLEDVRVNLDHATARHFVAHGFWLHSTLLLRESMPLYHLARLEGGVLVDEFPDRGQLYGVHRNEGDPSQLVPWRFKDPRVADFFALLVRVCAADVEGSGCAFFAADPEFALVSRAYAEAGARRELSPLAFALALLEVMERTPPPERRDALLREAVRRAGARASAPPLRGATGAGGGARLADDGAGPSAAARAVQQVVRRARAAPPAALAGVTFDSVEDVVLPGWRCVRVALAVAGRPLVIDLFDGREAGPCFLRSRHLRAVYSVATPVVSARERACLTALLRLIDAQLDGAGSGDRP